MDKNSVSISRDSEFRLLSTRPADLENLRSWFKTKRDLLLWGGPTMQESSSVAAFVNQLTQNQFMSYSLVSGDELVGFVQLQRYSKHCIHLGRLVINPAHRGLGLSHILLQQVFKLAQKKFKSRQASLIVYRSNNFAIQCYMKNGFVSMQPPQDMQKVNGCEYMLKNL